MTLDGSTSYDQDEDGESIEYYRWSISHWTGSGYSSPIYVETQDANISVELEMGKYQIELSVLDDEGWWCDSHDRDKCYVHIIHTHLTRAEGYVGIGGLVDIALSIEPDDINIGGDARLSKTCTGNGDVNVWRPVDNDKTGYVLSLPWSYPLGRGAVPSPLYVEGTVASSSTDDVELKLRYVVSGWQGSSRTVRFTIKPDAGNTPAQATEIDITKPIFEAVGPIAADPEDWYKFTVSSGGLFNVELGFDDPGANLDWYVFSTSDTVNPIVSKTTSSNPETGVAGLSPGQYYLRIVDVDSLTAPCSFKVTTTKTLTVNADIDVDSNRSGSVEGDPNEENIEEQVSAIVPVNCDNDDYPQYSDVDCTNNSIDCQSDLSDLVPLVIRALPSGWTATLKIESGDPNTLRVFSGNDYWQPGDPDWFPGQQNPAYSYPILGAREYNYPDVNECNIPDPNVEHTFYMEATRFRSAATDNWTLLLTATNGSATIRDRVCLRPSPFMLIPATNSAEEVYVVDEYSSGDDPFVQALCKAVGSLTVTDVFKGSCSNDYWFQDEFEIGYTSWPGGGMHVAWNLPRGGGLDSWVPGLLGPNMGYWAEGGAGAGGCIEVVPSSIAGSNGVVITGTSASGIENFIAAQGVQTQQGEIIDCNTTWLGVGDIDEIVSLFDNSVAIADCNAALKILDDVNESCPGTTSASTTNTLTSTVVLQYGGAPPKPLGLGRRIHRNHIRGWLGSSEADFEYRAWR